MRKCCLFKLMILETLRDMSFTSHESLVGQLETIVGRVTLNPKAVTLASEDLDNKSAWTKHIT